MCKHWCFRWQNSEATDWATETCRSRGLGGREIGWRTAALRCTALHCAARLYHGIDYQGRICGIDGPNGVPGKPEPQSVSVSEYARKWLRFQCRLNMKLDSEAILVLVHELCLGAQTLCLCWVPHPCAESDHVGTCSPHVNCHNLRPWLVHLCLWTWLKP